MRNFLVSFRVPETKLGTLMVAADAEGFQPESIKLIIESLTELGQEAERLMKLRRPKQKRNVAFGTKASYLRDFIVEQTRDQQEFTILDLLKVSRQRGFSDSGIRTQLYGLIKAGQMEQLVKGKGATYRWLTSTPTLAPQEPANAE